LNIAFFGGSFDPPHLGHDAIVKMALDALNIDKLIIMPTFINPFKSDFTAPPNLRLKWINSLWGEIPKVEISTFEIEQNRPVPTIESVRFLQSRYDCENFYLIVGADHLATLHMWDEFEELKKRVKFVIASRNHIEIPQNLEKFDININISSSQIRENLDKSAIDGELSNEIIKFYKGTKMEKRVQKIADILNEKKAENVEIIDMRGEDYIAKFVVIATTLASRHAMSLVDDLKTGLKGSGEEFLRVESSDDWTVIDLGDILVHLMSEIYREKYDITDFLEKLKRDEA